MTMIPQQPAPEQFNAKLGQVPVWFNEHQFLLYHCPRCEGIFLYRTYRTEDRVRRWQKLRSEEEIRTNLTRFQAKRELLPQHYCLLCSTMAFGAHYEVEEQTLGGEHLGYLFHVVTQKHENILIQMRQRKVEYKLADVRTRWPEDGDHLQRATDWLLSTLSNPVPLIQMRAGLLNTMPYDIYDGRQPGQLRLHWVGYTGHATSRKLYYGDPEMSLALVISWTDNTQDPTDDGVRMRCAYQAGQVRQYLLACPY